MSKLRYLSPLLLSSIMFLGAGCSGNSAPQAASNVDTNAQADSAQGTQLAGSPESQASSTNGMVGGDAMASGTAQGVPVETKTSEGMVSTAGVREFTIDGGSFFYTPNVMKVKKGDKVKVTFKNVGGMHNFMLDEFGVKMDPIKTGESKVVEFTADKAGTFEYYCGVGQHRKMGQVGKLIVE